MDFWPRPDGLLGVTEGFRAWEDAMDASLLCLEGSLGGFLFGTLAVDEAGEAEGRVAGVEAFRSPIVDERGVDCGVAVDALPVFFGPSFGTSFFGATILVAVAGVDIGESHKDSR